MHHINNIPDLETFVLTLTGSSVVDFMCAYCLENYCYFPDKTSINTQLYMYLLQTNNFEEMSCLQFLEDGAAEKEVAPVDDTMEDPDDLVCVYTSY